MVNATPNSPTTIGNIVGTTTTNLTKTAPIDTIIFDDSLPVDALTGLVFEDIGGHELINTVRNDIVSGVSTQYNLIKNLNSLEKDYSPNNIINLQFTSDKYFSSFSVKADTKVPNEFNDGEINPIYVDADGNLIIEFTNLEPDEQVDIQIITDGTIYKGIGDEI